MDSNKTKSIAKLSVFTIAIMNVTAVVSLRGLPAEAEYGLSSAFYYLFAALVFLIPTALVAAELASMFANKEGGDRQAAMHEVFCSGWHPLWLYSPSTKISRPKSAL